MKYRIILILVLVFPLIQSGCTNQTTGNEGKGTAWAPGSFSSNGQRIYFTGTSESKTPVTYTGGPAISTMISGGKFACVSCHGLNAKGGRHPMGMEVMNAPDIRWSALINMQEKEDEHAENSSGEHHEYSFEDFKGSVEKGRHPDGDKVDEDMPRWKMSDADLRDVMNYLKSLK